MLFKCLCLSVLAALLLSACASALAHGGGLVQLPVATALPQDRASFERWLGSLALIDQRSGRYDEEDRMVYDGEYYTYSGCGPGAVANALITVMSVQDRLAADELAAEVIQMFRDVPYDDSLYVTMDHVQRLTNGEGDRYYPAWRALHEGFGGRMEATGDVLRIDEVRGEAEKLRSGGRPTLFFCRVSVDSRWHSILEYCHQLYQAGQRDALLVSFYLQGGNRDSKAPFHTSGGHYVTVVIQVGILEEEGRIYLLDAFPRACSRAEQEDTAAWQGDVFPFVNFSARHPFHAAWEVSRLNRVVLRMTMKKRPTPAGETLDQLLDRQTRALEALQLTGTGGFALLLP